MNTRIVKGRADSLLLVTVLAIMVFGVVMVFSASYYDTINELDNPYYYLLRVIVWAVAGVIAMAILSYIPYNLYYKLAVPIMVVCIFLLLALFTPLGDSGEEFSAARRWIAVGPVTFMPGEVVKIGVIVFVAWFYTKFEKYKLTFTKGILPMLLLIGTLFILIYLQPNLSTALIICGIIIAMMFVSGVRVSHLLLVGVGGIAAVIILLLTQGGFHLQRIYTFLDPFADPQGSGLQVIQSLLALATGGVIGLGPGNSIQKAQYLPEAQNDFIFAIIGEEFGFIGCMLVLVVFLLLIWRGAMISINAPTRFGMIMAAGITALFALQVFMNVAVVTSLMPPTGVILPFISYGGNAMLVFCGAIGMLLNISRYKKEEIIKELDA